jgi:AcrR family transcriptional regulator
MDSQDLDDQRLKKDAKMRRFYKTATNVFARKGYHETTVDEIAQAMGVAKGTIYYNFENKEDLYMSVVQEGVDLLKEQLQQAVNEGKTSEERIANLIVCQLKFVENESDLVSLFLTELFGNDPLRSQLASRMLSNCLQVFRSCIEAGIEDGALGCLDAETATSSLFGMITISALHYIHNHLPIPVNQVASDIGKIFLRGTCSRPD